MFERNRLLAVVLMLSPLLASARPPDGGGRAPMLPHDEISAEQRASIDAMLAHNVVELERAGLLHRTPALLMPQQSNLAWPLRAVASYTAAGYHGISNFVDLNPAGPNQLLDYNCGTRTYDLASGYDHAGIDFFTWPFGWLLMDQLAIDIVAAAPGTIIGKQDGFDDHSCPNNYSADWNAVYVQHADGTVAWYGHMTENSLTSKPVGATVAVGEFLGKVGSSGFSSGPHLHFENHSAVSSYTILEPFAGACRAGATLWAQQKPYYDSAINLLATHSAPPCATPFSAASRRWNARITTISTTSPGARRGPARPCGTATPGSKPPSRTSMSTTASRSTPPRAGRSSSR